MRRAGFSLIEMLIVVAIIAILSGLLFPVFARARERGRRIQCLSNMREVGRGIQMYLADSDELLPTDRKVSFQGNPIAVNPQDDEVSEGGENEGGPIENDSSLMQWYERVWPYLKHPAVFVCPYDLGRKVQLMIAGGDFKEFERTVSYGANRWFELDPPALKFPARPGDTILLGEVVGRKRLLPWPYAPQYNYEVMEMDMPWWQWSYGNGDSTWPPREGIVPRQYAARDLAFDRHNGGSNYLYIDGHVKWAKFEHVWGNGQSTNQFWPTR